ncbi:hypothetical protein FCM35_KLT16651 [Carex littledalei]|uniref:Uncharacterized protein n=1 Tax=Carex littledalei TaxID=544730 RepID=A0A833VRT5_9POAL|nr:hypothetical protein FCM35_KLT16651 [Carex littledalei]
MPAWPSPLPGRPGSVTGQESRDLRVLFRTASAAHLLSFLSFALSGTLSVSFLSLFLLSLLHSRQIIEATTTTSQQISATPPDRRQQQRFFCADCRSDRRS